MSGNKETRLRRVRQKAKPEQKLVVFFYDYDNINLYDAPHYEPGAQLVSAEDVERFQAEGYTVIVVSYGNQVSYER